MLASAAGQAEASKGLQLSAGPVDTSASTTQSRPRESYTSKQFDDSVRYYADRVEALAQLSASADRAMLKMQAGSQELQNSDLEVKRLESLLSLRKQQLEYVLAFGAELEAKLVKLRSLYSKTKSESQELQDELQMIAGLAISGETDPVFLIKRRRSAEHQNKRLRWMYELSCQLLEVQKANSRKPALRLGKQYLEDEFKARNQQLSQLIEQLYKQTPGHSRPKAE